MKNRAVKASRIFLPKKHKCKGCIYPRFRRRWAPVFWHPFSPNCSKKLTVTWIKPKNQLQLITQILLLSRSVEGVGGSVANGDCFWQCIQKLIAISFETLLLLITIQILGTGASQRNFGCPGKFSINSCLKKASRWREGQSVEHLLEQMFACFCPWHCVNGWCFLLMIMGVFTGCFFQKPGHSGPRISGS